MARAALRLLGVALLLLAASPRSARAGDGEWLGLDPGSGDAGPRRRRVWVEPLSPSSRAGGYGFLALRFENPRGEPYDAAASVHVTDGGADQEYARGVNVPGSGTARAWLPLPSATGWGRVEVRVGGAWRSTSVHPRGRSGGGAVLGIHAVGGRAGSYDPLLRSAGGASATPVADLVWCDAETLAPEGGLLTGFDLVILDAAPADLDAARQRALVQYVASGGHLALLRGGGGGGVLDELVDDVEAERVPDPDVRQGRLGFGSWILVDPDAARSSTDDITAWLRAGPLRQGSGGPGPYASAVPASFRLPLEIPGLGNVPTQAFFLLILFFAVVVGPLSYVYLKRRRRLAWLVFTVPALGFVAAGLILLYGFFSEGFGIRGVVRSFTVLDQRTHGAVTLAGRTLYAGLSPSSLQPGAGTTVLPPVLDDLGFRTPWIVDVGGGGRLDGAALPSRTPTAFTTTTVGAARERLRFRRRPDGRFEVLHGPDFAPVKAPGAVLLRTPDGTWYTSNEAGLLVPRPEGQPSAQAFAARSLLEPAAEMALADLDAIRASRSRPGSYYYWSSSRDPVTNDGTEGLVHFFQTTWEDGLPRGSYLARVEALSSLDDLGLDVRWEAREHVVLGRLGEEDIVE